MNASNVTSFTCFSGVQRVATGLLPQIAVRMHQLRADDGDAQLMVFDNSSGRNIDIDTHGTPQQMLARLAICYPQAMAACEAPNSAASAAGADGDPASAPRGRGRPKLGVVAREVTLLPRHWDWLAAQPGGASVALRRLVEQARRANADQDWLRQASERTYYFLQTMAGDRRGFEEASRALFAHDRPRFEALMQDWPEDVRQHALWLAFEQNPGEPESSE